MSRVRDKLLKWYIAIKECERGATAVEYGLIVALIAAVIIAVVALLGTEIREAFQAIVTKLEALTYS